MTRYIAQRLLAGLLTAFLVSLLIFVILRTTFDPLNFIVCMDDCEFTEEELRKLREDFGVYGPLHTQYFRWTGGLVTGDWGESWFSSENIREMFFSSLPTTLPTCRHDSGYCGTGGHTCRSSYGAYEKLVDRLLRAIRLQDVTDPPHILDSHPDSGRRGNISWSGTPTSGISHHWMT